MISQQPRKSKNTISSQLPELNSSRLGQFFNQDEVIRLDSGEEATLTPAKFEKIPLKNKVYSLTDNGNYLIGQQFPTGEYWISVKDDLPSWEDKNGKRNQGMIQLVVYSPKKVKDSKSYKLTEDNKKMKVILANNKFLAIKTNGQNIRHLNTSKMIFLR